ncbi:MAG TPA: sigma-70 family RNA polymerase sigma factor [Mycobacteriales bacterium]|jgi:RNA polymerase sigma-70 factor (ECF subfamily)
MDTTMISVAAARAVGPATAVDPELAVTRAAGNEQWLDTLAAGGRPREQAVERLHALLLRVARAELGRRSNQHALTGPELDDLAHQAAADAVLAILGKLDQFRGESRFTTWAYRFAVLEVSTKLGRHFWHRHPASVLEADDWDRLPDRFGMRPDEHAQHVELVTAVREAVQTALTERQRSVFLALVVNAVPLDAVVAQTGSTRNAIYKTMFDARRKLRAALAANGYVDGPDVARQPSHGKGGTRQGDRGEAAMTGWAELEQFLRTDPADVGCDQALQMLHVYTELVRDPSLGPSAADRTGAARARYPGVAAHLAACGPCGDDFEGLLAAVQAEARGELPAEPEGTP